MFYTVMQSTDVKSLRNTSIETIKLIPPAVSTALAGPGGVNHGAPLQYYCNTMWKGEIEYGLAATADLKKAQEPNKQ